MLGPHRRHSKVDAQDESGCRFRQRPPPPGFRRNPHARKNSAQDFDAKDGGNIEDSGDGGKNVGFLHVGNTLDYLIQIKDAGSYAITLQTSTAQDGTAIELLLSGQSLGTIACPTTGDWHKWSTTHPVTIKMDPGSYVLRLRIVHDPINIRSITVQKNDK